MTTADVLDRAADTLEKYGWIRGTSGSPKTGFCAVGAIDYVSYKLADSADSLDYHARSFLEDFLRVESVTYWNDSPNQTKRNVVGALRRAAKAWRKIRG